VQSSFTDLGVSAEVIHRLAGHGISTPTPVQVGAIPAALAGGDVCGKAPTGSGKTLAFGIPLAARVGSGRPGRPAALVLAPTRELAAQIAKELAPLLALRRRSVATFYGGVGFGPQLKELRRGVDVAVACPGRLTDLVARGAFHLDAINFVVVDEADRLADMGFLPALRKILDAVPADRQTLLFSATLDRDVDVLIRSYQRDPVRCEVEAEPADDKTEHLFVTTPNEGRIGATADLVRQHGSTLVFCRTKHGADRVATQLERAGLSAVAIHGNRSQSQRERALAAFSSRRVQVLVATDVAARGIHVDDVACVVHFDPAGDAKDYVHRSGRTGRAGAAGVVVSLVTEAVRGDVGKLRRDLNMPGAPDAADERGSRSGAPARSQAGRSQAGRSQAGRSSAAESGQGGAGGGGRTQSGAGRQGATGRQGGTARNPYGHGGQGQFAGGGRNAKPRPAGSRRPAANGARRDDRRTEGGQRRPATER